MPTRQIRQTIVLGGVTYTKVNAAFSWENSARYGSKLRLAAHKHNKLIQTLRGEGNDDPSQPKFGANPSGLTPAGWAPMNYPAPTPYNGYFSITPIFNRLLSESYARFRGKLYKGSAALGVTIGSYKQSREMIVNRFNQLRDPWNHLGDLLEKDRRKGRIHQNSERLSGAYLETIFGMVPLYQDIVAATTSVCQLADQLDTVRAVARANSVEQRQVPGLGSYGLGNSIFDITYSARVTRAAQVRITNPNTWLMERAGLLNPAAVALDLVPWSFILNMFVSTGQLVNSITDFAGLTFENESTTQALNSQIRVRNLYPKGPYPYPGPNIVKMFDGVFETREKKRTLGAVARPPMIFKIPKANWELAGIAASLVTQRISRVASLLKRV